MIKETITRVLSENGMEIVRDDSEYDLIVLNVPGWLCVKPGDIVSWETTEEVPFHTIFEFTETGICLWDWPGGTVLNRSDCRGDSDFASRVISHIFLMMEKAGY